MKILNFGSLNIDHVYNLPHFVRPGETLKSHKYERFSGGKGLNQSIALARAGAVVFHAGCVGPDGLWLKNILAESGVDTSLIESVEGPSGHALIQVVPDGANSIIIHGGANENITREYIESVMDSFASGDYLLLQNEINSIPEIMARGAELNMKIVFNPAPMDQEVMNYPLETVDCFIVNETEGWELTGKKEAERILAKMVNQYPGAVSVLTLGEKGALLGRENEKLAASVEKVQAIDTTAAGDTFIGFFLASLASGRKLDHALDTACKAAAICVTRAGAADSIPSMEEVSSLTAHDAHP